MKEASWVRTCGAFCMFVAVVLSTTMGYGAVTADPAQVTFTSPQQSATVKLMKDGMPIPAKDVQGWKFLASGHDYREMITVEKMDGAIKIAPSNALEVGSYDLSIETAAGSVVVQVFAPLSDLPDIVQKKAAATGDAEEKIRKSMGLTTGAGRETVNIELAPVYYEGQTLELKVETQPGRTQTWFMNGELIAEGPDQNAIAYTFKEPGEYVLNYVETEKKDGRTVTVARAEANTRVAAMPAVPTDTAVGVQTEFLAPSGYKEYVWTVDGQERSTESSLKYTFKAPGAYAVECLASSPEQGPVQGFQRVKYEVTVRRK